MAPFSAPVSPHGSRKARASAGAYKPEPSRGYPRPRAFCLTRHPVQAAIFLQQAEPAMATPPIRGNTAAPRTGEDEGSAFERDLTVFFELKMWRWLNSLGNFTNEKSVVERLISADVHEHLSRAVVCFREEADFEDFDEWIRQQGGTVPYADGTKTIRIKARANVRTISVRYVPIGLGLEEVTRELAKYG